MHNARAALEQALSGRYAFERELGRGGMATVYLVQDLKHDRLVALKVLLPELARNLGAERFQREIHFAARLQHPHILTVLDSGEADGQLWFTMPFVDGESLRGRLNRERQLAVGDALRIAEDVGRALHHAHEQGVVHRDIKPENILLTRDGSTLVADFGIARALTGDERLTQTGMAIGTPAYMSPEQAAGDKAIDARSDTYSLAALLYEMLAGEPPFTGPTAQAVLAKRFTEPVPSVRRMRSTVTAALDDVIQQGMARLAADRHATTSEFVRALVTAQHAVATPAPAAPPAPRRAWKGAAAALVAVAIAIAVFLGWQRTRRGTTTVGPTADVIRVAVLPFENRGDSADAYFADGMAEAVRAKLTGMPGLAVIARSSSESYARSSESMETIARELDVDYLLAGTVRWARARDGTSRVQVNPELIQVVRGQAQSRWQQPFDAPVDDVFAVQGDIATKVAGALNVRLAPQDTGQLGQRPTASLAAYEAFLKGQEYTGVDLHSARRTAAYFGEAARLDSSFAAAWASWARALASVASWPGEVNEATRDTTLRALARALALDSTSVDAYMARMAVATRLTNDEAEAAAALHAALARYPNHPAITRIAGADAESRDDFASAVILLERAAQLDPRSANTLRQYGLVLSLTGRQDAARTQLERALTLAPGDHYARYYLAATWVLDGDLDAARKSIAGRLGGSDGAEFGSVIAMLGMNCLMTPAQNAAILELSPEKFQGDRGARALVFTEVHHQLGNAAQSKSWAEVAYGIYSKNEVLAPYAQSLAAVSLAYWGKPAEAIRQGLLALRSAPARLVNQNRLEMARIYMLAGDAGKAMEMLKQAHAVDPATTAALLRCDPLLARLQDRLELAAPGAARPT